MITQVRLKAVLHYDPDTGLFTWVVPTNRAIKIGSVAGNIGKHQGYVLIGIDGVVYRAHRLAVLYKKGYFPEGLVDHKDRVRHHNWWSNLRESSYQCNTRNTGNFSTNTSGVKGVSWIKTRGKWGAAICVNGKTIYLGCYLDFDEAVAHRLAAEQSENWAGCDSSSPAYVHMEGLQC